MSDDFSKERIKELEEALSEIHRRTSLLIHQNTGRWRPSRVEHDKRTVDVLLVNQTIATNALAGIDTYDLEPSSPPIPKD